APDASPLAMAPSTSLRKSPISIHLDYGKLCRYGRSIDQVFFIDARGENFTRVTPHLYLKRAAAGILKRFAHHTWKAPHDGFRLSGNVEIERRQLIPTLRMASLCSLPLVRQSVLSERLGRVAGSRGRFLQDIDVNLDATNRRNARYTDPGRGAVGAHRSGGEQRKTHLGSRPEMVHSRRSDGPNKRNPPGPVRHQTVRRDLAEPERAARGGHLRRSPRGLPSGALGEAFPTSGFRGSHRSAAHLSAGSCQNGLDRQLRSFRCSPEQTPIARPSPTARCASRTMDPIRRVGSGVDV